MVGTERENFEDLERLDCRKRRFQSLNFTFFVRSFRCIALFLRFFGGGGGVAASSYAYACGITVRRHTTNTKYQLIKYSLYKSKIL